MFTLNIGCYRGTITSRDRITRTHETYQAAYDDYQKTKEFWTRIGYVVWFAIITKPDGSTETLEQNIK